jgi:anti-sigma B factor antagonist
MRSSIREKDVGGIIVLSVDRTLKGSGELSLKERIDELVRDGRLQILVDLRDVPHLDSTELGRLIRAHLSVRQAGGRVRLCNVSERILVLLKITRLDTVLDLYATEEQALTAFAQGNSNGHRPEPSRAPASQ